MSASQRDGIRLAFDRYEQRVAEIAQTRQGALHPELVQELIEATAEISGCIPVSRLEVLARRISDGEPINEPATDEYVS